MLDDIGAVEVNIFDQRPAVLAVEDDVFFLSRRATTLDHDADRVRRSLGRMRNIWRNEKRFAFVHNVIDDAIAFANAHFDVALELIEILLRIDQMKIVSRVRTLDDHHEKIAPVIEITVAYRWLEKMAVLCDPVFEINRLLHCGCGAAFRSRFCFQLGSSSHKTSVFASTRSVKLMELMLAANGPYNTEGRHLHLNG